MKELYFNEKDLSLRWQEIRHFFQDDKEKELDLCRWSLDKVMDIILKGNSYYPKIK